MRLIERYIFLKAATTTMIIVGSLTGVVWIIQALKEIDIISNKGQAILTYLSLTTLSIPILMMAIIPIALLLATIHTINGMNANSELVVVTASGSSNWTLAKPLMILALLCSMFTGFVGHIISPASLVKARGMLTEISADLVSIIVREGSFNTIEAGLTFHVAKREAGGILSGILIADDREKDVSIIYSAREGIINKSENGSFLKLKDGEIQQTNRKDGSITLIKYQSYIFDLSSFSGNASKGLRKAKERTTLELLNPNPNDKFYQKFPGRYRSQIHERFSEMLWPFAFVLVVLAYSGQARSNRQSFSTSITMAFITVLAARGTGFSAVNNVKTDPGAIWQIYALPLGCIIFGAFFVIRNKPVSLPKSIIDRIDAISDKVSAFNKSAYNQYKAFRRKRAGLTT